MILNIGNDDKNDNDNTRMLTRIIMIINKRKKTAHKEDVSDVCKMK